MMISYPQDKITTKENMCISMKKSFVENNNNLDQTVEMSVFYEESVDRSFDFWIDRCYMNDS